MSPEKLRKMTMRLIVKTLKKSDSLCRQATRDHHMSRLLPGKEGRRLRYSAFHQKLRASRIKAFGIRLAQIHGIDLNAYGRDGGPDRSKKTPLEHLICKKKSTPRAAAWQ